MLYKTISLATACLRPGAVKPHHAMTADGRVVLGYSHLGMLAAARWLMACTKATLIEALQENPGYELRIVGESLPLSTGAGQ